MAHFAEYCDDTRISLLTGGTGMRETIKDLEKKPQIIVATPGRLGDMIDRRSLSLSNLSLLLVDELDSLFDAGYEERLVQLMGVSFDSCGSSRSLSISLFVRGLIFFVCVCSFL
jgi:superfamily II DNA/RNA helicase